MKLNILNILVALFLISLLISKISNNKNIAKSKDFFKLNDNYSSASLAEKEFNNRKNFYNFILKEWKLENKLKLLIDNENYILELKLKKNKNLTNNSSINLNWEYFITSCDFTPFKEKIGQYVVEYSQKNPTINNTRLINLIILTYQILYYRLSDSKKITQFYEKYFFKSLSYNKNVFNFEKTNINIKKYYKEVIPRYSYLKNGILFFSDEDLKLAKKLQIDTVLAEQINKLFNYVTSEFKKEIDNFKEEYISTNKNNIKEKDFKLQNEVNNNIYTFISNEYEFKSVLSYLLKSVNSVSFDFYKERFQGKEKEAYELYVKTFGKFSNDCYYIGPLVDLFKPNLNDSIENNNINYDLDVEFTGFYTANLYSKKEQKEGNVLKFSYNMPFSNERFLLEFHPEYLTQHIINPHKYHAQLNNKDTDSTIADFYEINYNDYTTFNFSIFLDEFTENQIKLCLIINCGEKGLVAKHISEINKKSKIVNDNKDKNNISNNKYYILKEDLSFEHSISLFTNKFNYEFYNLLRVYEYDSYVSHNIEYNNDELFELFSDNKEIHRESDLAALFKYFYVIFDEESRENSYLDMLLDYYELSSMQKGLEGFNNSLSDKLFYDIGSKTTIYLHAIARKYTLYNNMIMALNKIEEEITKDINNFINTIL